MSKLSGVKNWFKGKSSAPKDDNTVEVVVCKENEMSNGEMRQIDIADGKALLVKDKDKFYAIGPKCSHFGAPLHKGAYCNLKVRCPWHGACFSVETGDIEDFPGLDSIPHYQVKIEKKMVKVIAKKDQIANARRQKPVSKIDSANKHVFVILGGGGAGASCVETLRQEGYTGRIVMVTEEKCLPYDRTKLSKTLNAKPSDIGLRNAEFYENLSVEVMLGKKVTKVDVNSKTVHLDNEETLHYDKLLCATGAGPRTLDLPGEDMSNVFILRNIEDANKIAACCEGKKVVLIGTSFIGLELAAYMLDKGSASAVTLVGRSKVPLINVFGEKIGEMVKKLIEDRGAKFVFDDKPEMFVGNDGKLTGVKLASGNVLDADICVLGIGVTPNTHYLKESSIRLDKDGRIVTDECMATSVADVYAAGDVSVFPLFMSDNELVNVQHWQMALKQGNVAGRNMAGKKHAIHSVPFFWTVLFGKSIRYAGYGAGHDDVIVHGDLDEYKFVAYYTKSEKVIAVATLGTDPLAAQAAEMFSNKIPLLKKDVTSDTAMPPAWTSKLAQVRASL